MDPLKKMPLKDLKKLIEAHTAATLLLDRALQDIPNLPKQPYQLARGLFANQLDILIEAHIKRTSETKTEKLMATILESCTPSSDEAANG